MIASVPFVTPRKTEGIIWGGPITFLFHLKLKASKNGTIKKKKIEGGTEKFQVRSDFRISYLGLFPILEISSSFVGKVTKENRPVTYR